MHSAKRTPIYNEHLKLGARMVEFGGWEMPLHYPQGILTEHLAVRKHGGLFDISHMGRFRVSGRDALPFLQYVLTSNAAALLPGNAQYTMLPNETGGAIDDGYLYRVSESDYLLVVNAANTEADWKWLQKHVPGFPRLTMEDITGSVAMFALQGPKTKAVLETVIGDKTRIPEPLWNRLTTTEIMGASTTIARTGYTGEPLGFELFPPADNAVSLWRKLLEAGSKHGIVPVGLGARDTLRLEAGFPLYGHELGTDAEGKEVPIFALSAARFAVSFSPFKGEFIGREALFKQFQEVKLRREGRLDTPRNELLVPRSVFLMSLLGDGVARAGSQVLVDGRPVGNVTSGTIIPYWNFAGSGTASRPGNESARRMLCLAYIDADISEKHKVEVVVRDKAVNATIVRRHIGGEAPPYAHPLLPGNTENNTPANGEKAMEELAVNLIEKAHDNTMWRQQQTVNLIPSEQTASPLVKLLTIADPSHRYAEHRRVEALGNMDAFYYQGTSFIAGVETEVQEQLKKFLGCSEVEARLISGQMANVTTYSGIMDYLNRVDRHTGPRRIRYVMNHHIGRGGHLSAQAMGGLRDFVAIDPATDRWAVVNFPVLPENPYQIDVSRTAELIARYQPELLILGKSMTLHREPVKEVAKIIADMKPKPVVLYDGAHVLGLLGHYFQEPLNEGADIITASTHKTFFGTQRGIIASNMSRDSDHTELWASITRRAFPGSVSNHHLGTLLGLLMATYEMNAYGRDYQRQVLANAGAFARALKERGLQVEGDPAIDYTETHQVLLRVGYARGVEMAERLEKNNIIVNFQALPDDEAFTASSGLRTGVQEMTRFGMKEADFAELADYMAAVILEEKDVPDEVTRFRKKFTTMHYCLPAAKARPLIDKMLAILLK
ncbi:MAG TPA: glycine cleavage system aminomethyltransferase GcvT [Dehalococcoidales bacterium]|nr:glycine cleavage system aminomethyltransferase GcvT [Dehalococcoidales bacterium]